MALRVFLCVRASSARLFGYRSQHAALFGDEAVLDYLGDVFTLRILSILVYFVIFELRVTVLRNFIVHARVRHNRAGNWSAQ